MNRTTQRVWHRLTAGGFSKVWRRFAAGGLVIICLGFPGRPADAQAPPPAPAAEFDPDLILELNEGIRSYQQGGLDPEFIDPYLQAIEHFDVVLQKRPDERTALLFRCLSHGRIGLANRRQRDGIRNNIVFREDIQRLIQDEGAMDRLNEQIEQASAAAEDASLGAAQQYLNRKRAEDLTSLRATTQGLDDASIAALPEEIAQLRTQVQEIAQQEADSLTRMRADLTRLLGILDSPGSVVHLLDVLSAAKIARIDEERAAEMIDSTTTTTSQPAQGTPDDLRRSAEQNLEHAAGVLQQLLREELDDETQVRARFFLGVIRFRQAVPRRAEGEDSNIDSARLAEADQWMAELVGDQRTDDAWKSYAWLYRGMIASVQGVIEANETVRTQHFDSARQYLNQAAELDIVTEGEQVSSRSGDVIPNLVWQHREQIEDYETQPAAGPRFQNNLQLSVGVGAIYDTNVTLLGERTDLPRGIAKKRDFGFTLNTALDYTLDLGRLDERLDRWTIGLQGRVGQLWHVEVDEFDEQNYGASAAVQYELIRQEEGFGPVHLRVQYDYDLTLLGRSRFLEAHAVTPNVRVFAFDRRSLTDLYFRFADRVYSEPLFDRRFERSGEYFELGLGQQFKWLDMTGVYEQWNLEPWGLAGDESFAQDDPDYPARYLTPYFGAHYRWDQTDGEEFDQKEYGLLVGVRLPLPYGIELDASGAFDWQDYKNGSLVDYHRRGRDDFIQQYGVGLSRTFALRNGELANRYELEMDRVLMTIRAYASWTLDDSNVVDRLGRSIFEYDRAIYGLSVIFSFN